LLEGGQTDAELKAHAQQQRARAASAWEDFAPARALEATWDLVRRCNTYLAVEQPWARMKEGDRSRVLQILRTCCEALRWSALMVGPAMPGSSAEILRQLGKSEDDGSWPDEFEWKTGRALEPTPIFPRIDPERQAALIAEWVPAGAEPAAPAARPASAAPSPSPVAPPSSVAPPVDLSIEDFAKIDLRAAKVLSAEKVPKADKLLKLTLDLGEPTPRTVVSGIADRYAPEALVGRTLIYLANLAPRKIRGVVSQGMILAAGDAEVLGLSALDREVPPGTKIR
jgi:methionyl-tRNA synthetase